MHPLLRAHLFLFSPACWQCGRLMEPFAHWREEMRKREGSKGAENGFPYLCGDCFLHLPWTEDGESQPPAPLDRVWAAFRYEHPVSQWVQRLKYNGRDGLCRLLGLLLREAAFGPAPLERMQAVMAVPLHTRRIGQRGFNQSHLLAHRWLRGLRQGIRGGEETQRCDDAPRLTARLLVRMRYTQPQVTMAGAQRESNVAGAFALHPALGAAEAPLRGLGVLLVDDVMTTGATLAACASVLKEAGAVRVEALVLARAGTAGRAEGV